MLRPPEFWRNDGGGLAPWLLRPFEGVTARLAAARVARPGWRAPVPVLCCGNVGLGGAGKTIEADETYVGRKPGTKVRRGAGHKNAVVALVERESCEVRSFHVPNVTPSPADSGVS